MSFKTDRRGFIKLVGLGGAVFASGLPGFKAFGAGKSKTAAEDFFFVQLSDTHWGFAGPPNPEAENTLKQAVEKVNELPQSPDFIVFTGDLTHTTDDPAVRRKRMAEFKEIVSKLKVQKHYYMPGEHDASLDEGKAFIENFGKTHYSFNHKGIHFSVLDNVSDPEAKLGDPQIDWLKKDLKGVAPDGPVVIFTHRPLFDLAPQWDWATKDGAKAIDLLGHWKNTTVFYGHIHQEHHFTTGDIQHHAATSLVFPLPPPMSQPKRAPVPWDPEHPRRGLGFREVTASGPARTLALKQDSMEGTK